MAASFSSTTYVPATDILGKGSRLLVAVGCKRLSCVFKTVEEIYFSCKQVESISHCCSWNRTKFMNNRFGWSWMWFHCSVSHSWVACTSRIAKPSKERQFGFYGIMNAWWYRNTNDQWSVHTSPKLYVLILVEIISPSGDIPSFGGSKLTFSVVLSSLKRIQDKE